MPGWFVVSIDFELAWGFYDKKITGNFLSRIAMERSIVHDLLQLLSAYSISATWAVVGRLCVPPKPVSAEQEMFARLNGQWFAEQPSLWYAKDLCIEIANSRPRQEIASHGFSHADWSRISRSTAQDELLLWSEALQGIADGARSFVFPRNHISHLDVLKSNGFCCFRDVNPSWQGRSRLERVLVRAREELLETSDIAHPATTNGLCAIPGTLLWQKAKLRGGWSNTMRRALNGLEAACSANGVFHLWFHPVNLAEGYPDGLTALEKVFARASELRKRALLEILPMALCESRTGCPTEH